MLTKMLSSKKILTLSILASLPLLQGCIVAAAGGAATGAASVVTDKRSTGTIIDDQSIEIKATNALSKNKALWHTSHISLLSYNNVLLMVGQVTSEDYKRQAEDAVSTIPKIRQIHNELTIAQPLPIRSRTHDSLITTKIKAKMLGRKNFHANRVKVITEDRVVYLMGITTPEEQQIATDIARELPGVEKVVQIFENAY